VLSIATVKGALAWHLPGSPSLLPQSESIMVLCILPSTVARPLAPDMTALNCIVSLLSVAKLKFRV
jgi:hypothetical protein